jgi:hypothetical protein
MKVLIINLLLLITAINIWSQPIEKRNALFIGNSKYSDFPLRKPERDAEALAVGLQKSGFKTLLKNNLSKDDFKNQIIEFKSILSENKGVGFFFFSGYGMNVKGENYLLPTGINIKTENDIAFEGVSLKGIIQDIQSAGCDLNIIILDIYPDCPYQKNLDSTVSYNIRVELTSRKTILVFTYLQGSLPCNCFVSGLFTREFIKTLQIANINITDFLKIVKRNVRDYSKGRQIPWDNASNQNFIFNMNPD